MSDTHEQSCIFCQIAQGKAPAHLVWEDDSHMAFLTIFPNTSGFTVVIPKAHLPSDAFANTQADLLKLVAASQIVAKKLVQAFPDVGRCGMFLEGFGVNHLHSKLFPMHGTGEMKEWQQIESKEPVFFEHYPGFLSSQEGKRADDQELARIAQQIRDTIPT